MENEMGSAISIAVELMVIALVIGVVVMFNAMGKTFSRSTVEMVESARMATYGTEIESLNEYDAPIPASSIYVLIQKNPSLIRNVSGAPYGVTITNVEDLKRLFHKKIKFKATQVMDRYDVVLTE